MGNRIDGRACAEKIHDETGARVQALKSAGVEPALAFVRVGEDPASKVYVGMKEKASARLGIQSRSHVLNEETSEKELLGLVEELNQDPQVHGILVQAPVPDHIDSARVFAKVDPEKDVDGFHPLNLGKLLLGDRTGFVPCTPAGIHELLIRSGIETKGAEVVILGRGNIVGKPMAVILMQKAKGADSTVTLCHSRTREVSEHCRRADILIAAMGQPHLITKDMVKPGAAVIDVGVNRISDPSVSKGYRLIGDVDFDGVMPVAGWITPNPGGVGPMTIAMLMRNTVRAAEQAGHTQHG